MTVKHLHNNNNNIIIIIIIITTIIIIAHGGMVPFLKTEVTSSPIRIPIIIVTITQNRTSTQDCLVDSPTSCLQTLWWSWANGSHNSVLRYRQRQTAINAKDINDQNFYGTIHKHLGWHKWKILYPLKSAQFMEIIIIDCQKQSESWEEHSRWWSRRAQWWNYV